MMARNELLESQRDGASLDANDRDEEEVDLKETLKASIAVQVRDAGVLRKTLSVTVPRDSINQELDKEYKTLIQDAIVPGFRRGRAPRRLVEKRFGGEVGAQVQTRLVSNAYLAAIEKEDLKVLGDPLVWVRPREKSTSPGEGAEKLVDMPTALQQMRLPEDGPLEFRCEVEVKPQFDLPKLEGVVVERPELTITEEDVDQQIKRIQARRGHWAPVEDGRVEIDDLLICDLVLAAGTTEIKRAENIQVAARPQRIEGVTLEDFGEKVKGAKAGDSRTFEGTLPDDYENEAYRGKAVTFTLKVNDIKRLTIPPMDQEFLTNLGFDSEEEYRDFVRRQMEDQLDVELKRGMRQQVRKYLLDQTKLDLPEGISTRQTERAVLRKMIDLSRQGVPEAEIAKHADELRTIAQEEVTQELKLHFILEDVAEKFEIEVTEEDINAQIASIARAYNRRFDRVRDDLAKNGGIESLYLQIRDDKCLDRILEKADVRKTEVPRKEPAKAKKPAETAKAEKTATPAEKAPKAEKPKKETPAKAEKSVEEKPKTRKPGGKAGDRK